METGAAPRAAALDGTLRAVIAADRLALSEAEESKELLHKRLTVFYAYFALFGICGTIVSRLRTPPVEPETFAFVLDIQVACALLLCVVFVALKYWLREPTAMRAADLSATAAVAVTAGVALYVVPRPLSVDVTVVSFFILFFVLRAALVPSKPWQATLVAALSAIPFTIGLAAMYTRADVFEPHAATLAAMRAMLGGIVGVFVVSKTIYGLRQVVQHVVQLGQYVVHEKIGEGGMGTVYRASHALLKRPTAIKLVSPERATAVATARFEREVLAASRLTHPNTVAIYDFGRTRGGVFYYAMELLDGVDLGRLVEREGCQPLSRTLGILRQLAGALSEAHDAGLVHRDVKPQNIMLCTRGGIRDFVKVLDFGLVKDVTTPGAQKLTREMTVAGTPLYMAPETILASDSVGPPVDIYAFGGVAYYLLCGRAPFEGSAAVELWANHLHTQPDPPSRHAKVPPEVDGLILRCLAKNPHERPSARELEGRLRKLAEDQLEPIGA